MLFSAQDLFLGRHGEEAPSPHLDICTLLLHQLRLQQFYVAMMEGQWVVLSLTATFICSQGSPHSSVNSTYPKCGECAEAMVYP